MTDGWVNSLTDAAGRRRLTTFGPYVANLGYPPDERIADVATIYCGGDADALRRADAALRRDLPRSTADARSRATSRSTSGRRTQFELAYDGGPRIWRLRDPEAGRP